MEENNLHRVIVEHWDLLFLRIGLGFSYKLELFCNVLAIYFLANFICGFCSCLKSWIEKKCCDKDNFRNHMNFSRKGGSICSQIIL